MSRSTEPDYRNVLRQELLARIRRNPKYSLRAFARHLAVSPSFMSQVLNGTRKLGLDKAYELSERMGLRPTERQRFIALVRYAQAGTERARKSIRDELDEGHERDQGFGEALFRAVSEWHHFAIVELTEVEGFRADPRWIARRLGLSVHQIQDAIVRLVEVGLLARAGGTLRRSRGFYEVADVPSQAIRGFHKQHLELALRAVDEQPFEARDFSGLTMAIDPKRLPEAREMIRAFERKFSRAFEKGPRQRVYHLAVQLYRVEET